MTCGCRGSGWVDVDDAYVDQVCPIPPQLVDEAELEALRVKRVALRNSVRPCPVHNPVVHLRWRTEQEAVTVPRSRPPGELRKDLE